jgi:hypothetical protein
MIQRLTGPRAISASKLADEVGVGQPTLSAWLREARNLGRMGNQKGEQESGPPRSPKSFTAEEKFKLVLEAASIPDADLGEFLRKNGLHAAHLEEWRRIAEAGAKAALAPGRKFSRPSEKSDKKRLRELERELLRKDRALAEMAALVALKKKLEILWGDEDGSTPTRSGT